MGGGEAPWTAPLPTRLTLPPHPTAAFLKGLSDKQREEHYFCRDFVRLKKIPTWKETAKGRPCAGVPAGWVWCGPFRPLSGEYRPDKAKEKKGGGIYECLLCTGHFEVSPLFILNTA